MPSRRSCVRYRHPPRNHEPVHRTRQQAVGRSEPRVTVSRCHGGRRASWADPGRIPHPPDLVATEAFSTGLPRFSLPAPHCPPFCEFPFRPGPRSWYSTATADYTQSGGTSPPWSSGCGGGGKEAKLARSWHDLRSDSWTPVGSPSNQTSPRLRTPFTNNSTPLRWLVPIQDRTEQLPGRWRVC
jgi:hypothetical protein